MTNQSLIATYKHNIFRIKFVANAKKAVEYCKSFIDDPFPVGKSNPSQFFRRKVLFSSIDLYWRKLSLPKHWVKL